MQKLGKTCSTSLARQGIIAILAILVGVPLACGCLLLSTLVIAPALSQYDLQTQNWALGGLFILAVGGLIGGVVLVWWLVNRARASRLDAAFVPLGLHGRPYMLNGRHYYGQVQGRALEVYVYRGPTIELRLPVSVQSRFYISDKSSASPGLERVFHNPPLSLPDSWQALTVYALDPAWMNQLLANPLAEAALCTLLQQGARWALVRQVELLPGELVLVLSQLSANSLELQEPRAWLEALLSLAQIAEGLPAPLVTAQSSGHNRAARLKINRSLNIIMLGLVVSFPLCAGSMFLAAVLLAR